MGNVIQKNGKLYYKDKLVGFYDKKNDVLLVDTSKLPEREVFVLDPSETKLVDVWVPSFFDKFDFIGTIKIHSPLKFPEQYKTWILRKGDVAIVGYLVLSAADLNAITSPMFINNDFLLFPRFMIEKTGRKLIKAAHEVRVYYNNNLNLVVSADLDSEPATIRDTVCKEYLFMDTQIEIYNCSIQLENGKLNAHVTFDYKEVTKWLK